MKHLILSIFLSGFAVLAFGQSLTLTPNQISEFVIQTNVSFPTVLGQFAPKVSGELTPVKLNEQLLRLAGSGYTGTNYSDDRAIIIMSAAQKFTSTNQGTNITFFTTTDSTTLTLPRMVINSDGNIGIGEDAVNNPQARLHVAKGNAGNVTMFNNTVATLENSNHAYLGFQTPNLHQGGVVFGTPSSNLKAFTVYDDYDEALYFGIGIGAGNTKMSILKTGNVGISRISPSAKLDINGDLCLSKITNTLQNTSFHNYDRNGASILRFASGGSLSGIAGGVDGMILYIMNASTNAQLILQHQDINSSGINRILSASGDIVLGAGGGATLIYDGITTRWRVVSVIN